MRLTEEQLNVSAPDRKRYLAQDSHSPLAGMVDFLESFYTQRELLEQIERLSAAGEFAAATRCAAWPRIADALTRWQQAHPQALDALPATTPAVGDTVADLAAEQGTGPAFSAAAGLLRTVGAVRTAPEPNPALTGFLTKLAQATCSRLIVRLNDPGLLRDLAAEVRTQLADHDIARGLEATALYRERSDDPRALESVDPDIRSAVLALLGQAADDAGALGRSKGSPD